MGNISIASADTRKKRSWRKELENYCLRLKQNATVTLIMKPPPYELRPNGVIANSWVSLGEALMENSSLEKLTLPHMVLDEKAALSLAKGIGHCRLRTLVVESIASAQGGSEPERSTLHISKIMGDGIGSSETLRSMEVNGYMACAPMVSILVKSCKLTTLQLRTCLDHVDGGAGMLQMTQALRYNTSLTILELEFCGIDDRQVGWLVDAFRPDLRLQRLSLALNRITPVGLQLLLNSTVSRHRTLQDLDLSLNPALGDKGLGILAKHLQATETCHLTRVWANSCCPNTSFQTYQAMLDSVVKSHHIKVLALSNNHFPDDIMNAIGFYTRVNQMGRYLLLSTNSAGLGPSIWCNILAKCQRRKYSNSLTFYLLREQPALFVQ